METGDPLVTADWLKQNISAPDIRIVDATYFAPFTNPEKSGREVWAESHIPGAVFFDIDTICAPGTDLPHMLPDPILFSSRVRKLGIGDGNRVIVYDRNNYCAAARVWWMLRVMGHNDVKVLDGGLAAWTAAGGDLEDMPPVAFERHFTARVRSDLVKDASQVAAASASGSHQIVDARPAARFTGEAPEPREGLSSGHIPGSLSVPSSEMVHADGTLKTVSELQDLLPDTKAATITTCGSGVTAAILALGYARLGNWDVAVYDGSWTEWASDPSRPVATGAA
ncbi:MAG: 3-mercaptopyruvate sulfurtransferase [Rhodobacterales bacterium]|jgi:thiosulfate/3-mercaptopyruvate sulfurtransferase|nr:3-mercaptopyruvate sulfurtransferase [Rhodobacterales bacterium]